MSIPVSLYRQRRLIALLLLVLGGLYLFRDRSPPVSNPDGPKAPPSKKNGNDFAQHFVQRTVKDNQIVAFANSTSPYSKHLESLLKSYGSVYSLKYHWSDVNTVPDDYPVAQNREHHGKQVKSELSKVSGQNLLPNMFIDGRSIGGYDQVNARHVSGELLRMLVKAGHLSAESVKAHRQAILLKIQQEIRDTFAVIYGFTSDAGTGLAVSVMKKYEKKHPKLTYKLKIIDSRRADHTQYAEAIREESSRQQLPAVFIAGKEVGGYQGLEGMDAGGDLTQQMIQAGLVEDAKPQNPAEKKVRALIKKNRVMVFSKTYCPYSRQAKRLLNRYKDDNGLTFTVIEVDKEPDPAEVKEALGKISGRFTFPNVFIDGESIGGFDDLQEQHANGELVQLLKKKNLVA